MSAPIADAPIAEGRIERRFAALRSAGRAGLVSFTMAYDPDAETSLEILRALPGAGVDLVELGVPFSDPMADGPTIQAAGERALAAGVSMARALDMVRAFRRDDDETPLVLMGYYNPIYVYGVDRFIADALAAGVDGVITVDLPPEEDAELCAPARAAGLRNIRLATPTTDAARLPKVLTNLSGFLYYVSVAGITGTISASNDAVADAVARLRQHTEIPIAVGFGIRTPEQARAIAAAKADAVVVGSALIARIAENLDENGKPRPGLVDSVAALAGDLAAGVHGGKAAMETEASR